MKEQRRRGYAFCTLVVSACGLLTWRGAAAQRGPKSTIGSERAIPQHLSAGDEFKLSPSELFEFGRKLFTANWTEQDGGGPSLSKGTGKPLSDRTRPLRGLDAYNRISGPDANSCLGCHRAPFNSPGGSGNIVANVFEAALGGLGGGCPGGLGGGLRVP